jgi:hypothetical protein
VAGWRNNDTFEEVSVRPAIMICSILSRLYTPDAQIELGSISLRHYNRADQTRVERATLANVHVDCRRWISLFHAPSWKLNIGMQTIKHRNLRPLQQLESQRWHRRGHGNASAPS